MTKFTLDGIHNPQQAGRILKSAGIKRVLHHDAVVLRNRMVSMATTEAKATGDYSRSFELQEWSDRTRSWARVKTSDPAWSWVEYGTRRLRPKRIMRRALEALRT